MSKGMAGFGKHVATVVVFFAVFVAFIVMVLTKSGAVPTPGSKYKVQAIVPSASLLTPGARVAVAGAKVGIVKKVERAGDVGPGAKITLELTDDRVTPLPRDSRIQIRTRSQVGENYVGIVVGRDRLTIPDGGTIGLKQADELVNVDQILSVLQGSTRERTRKLLQ